MQTVNMSKDEIVALIERHHGMFHVPEEVITHAGKFDYTWYGHALEVVEPYGPDLDDEDWIASIDFAVDDVFDMVNLTGFLTALNDAIQKHETRQAIKAGQGTLF